MNKSVSYESIKCNKGENILEIASAILCEMTDVDIISKIDEKLVLENTTLYIPATPSFLGTGDVASNFRFKHDKDINNNVVKRWMKIFENYSVNPNPVVITSVGRDARYMTFKLLENGKVDIVNNKNKNSLFSSETKIFENFLRSFSITEENMIKIRESSKGAKYNTYMADMIGFVNILNYNLHPHMFKVKRMEPEIITPDCKFYRSGVEGYKLKSEIINGKEWHPKEGFNYLYFRIQDKKTSGANTFCMLHEQYMPLVYSKLFNMLTIEDNDTKSKVRELMKNTMKYDRLSDYWYNDIDDAFTILMIINCYRYCELDEIDKLILERFKTITEPWFKEM